MRCWLACPQKSWCLVAWFTRPHVNLVRLSSVSLLFESRFLLKTQIKVQSLDNTKRCRHWLLCMRLAYFLNEVLSWMHFASNCLSTRINRKDSPYSQLTKTRSPLMLLARLMILIDHLVCFNYVILTCCWNQLVSELAFLSSFDWRFFYHLCFFQAACH